MAESFQFRLVTPTGVLYDGQVEQATAVGALGEFGVLPHHTNFITSLVPGVLTLRTGDAAMTEYLVSGGLAEVKDGEMTVLALDAVPVASVDPIAAAPEVQAAEEKLSRMSFYDLGYAEAEETLRLARSRAEIQQLWRAPH
jgi:F-type H+-transporting ATPase subunit epsilon